MSQFKLRIGGRTLVLPIGQHTVGRMPDCWLSLDDDLISRYHARFHVTLDSLELEDLGSRNGTFVNGERLQQRCALKDGDRVRIGREVMSLLGADASVEEVSDELRRTMAPEENAGFPDLIAVLVTKSLKVGKLKDAERYALALTTQLMAARVPVSHPTARSCVRCLLALAEHTASGTWIDRLFRLYATHAWIMDEDVLDGVRRALDYIPRIPDGGIRDYEHALQAMAKEGAALPVSLTETIGELADAYASG